MYKIIIAIGSNHDSIKNVEKAKGLLQEKLSNVIFTRTLKTKAIGDNSLSPFFHNALATATTQLKLDETVTLLKVIEKSCGDDANLRKCGIVNVDIDLLQYDNIKLHEADWQRDYIQLLIDEL